MSPLSKPNLIYFYFYLNHMLHFSFEFKFMLHRTVHSVENIICNCRVYKKFVYLRLIRPWALYVLLRRQGAWFTWMCSMTSLSTSSPLKSALLSAFFKSWSKNSADFFGHRPKGSNWIRFDNFFIFSHIFLAITTEIHRPPT